MISAMKTLLGILLLATGVLAESLPEEGLLLTVQALKDGGYDVPTINVVCRIYAEAADLVVYTKEIRKLKLSNEVFDKIQTAYLVGHNPAPGSDVDRLFKKFGTATPT